MKIDHRDRERVDEEIMSRHRLCISGKGWMQNIGRHAACLDRSWGAFGCFLGRSWAILAALGPSWAICTSLGAIFGRSPAVLGAALEQQTPIFIWFYEELGSYLKFIWGWNLNRYEMKNFCLTLINWPCFHLRLECLILYPQPAAQTHFHYLYFAIILYIRPSISSNANLFEHLVSKITILRFNLFVVLRYR